MKRISNVAGAIEVGGGGRRGSMDGGKAAIAPVIPVPIDALTNRPKSSAGHVVNWPAMRPSTESTAGKRRSRRSNLLTIGARCCVMSPDCIQNVDNSQPLASSRLPPKPADQGPASGSRLRSSTPLGRGLGHRDPAKAGAAVIRIGVSAWRVPPRTQPAAMRRTITATSSSGTPTGQAAPAALRSGPSPSTSEDASPKRE